MSTQMSVFLSKKTAAPHWGEKAIVSFSESAATIHLSEQHDLGAIQRAARKLDGQGIASVSLEGESWDLESVWAFHQGYRGPKKNN
ncbi:aminopeptidase PepB, partial [Vibrio sp. M260118]